MRACRSCGRNAERVFCRGRRPADDRANDTVLAVLAAAEQPSPASLERLAHEYLLKNELDGDWAALPLELVLESDRAMPSPLVSPGLWGRPIAAASFTRTSSPAISWSTARTDECGLLGSAWPRACRAGAKPLRRPTPDGQFSGNIIDEAMRTLVSSRFGRDLFPPINLQVRR
jgi:hypothetical protein